jgi:DNA-binding IclR family transcriptional regulator
MPGGRLTHEDRRLIAVGLTEGRGYAEIARQLDRPTSTVSREVLRNGGPAGYRADHAHHATAHRARRKPTLPAAPPATDTYGRDTEVVRAFADRFAAVLVETGIPRMEARVLVSLYLTDSGSLTSAELVHLLRVSPASVSKAIGYLENLELVRRERGSGRREHYLVDDDLWERAWSASARMNTTWAEAAREGADILRVGTPAGDRILQMSRMFERLGRDMGQQTDSPLLELARSHMISQLLYVAADLRLADAFGGSPRTYQEIAEKTGVDPELMHQLLLALVEQSLVYELDAGRFKLSGIGEQLRSDSIRGQVLLLAGPELRASWGAFGPHSVGLPPHN